MPLHVPVLLKEGVDHLQPRSGGTYVDGTLGSAGHAFEILKASAPSGRLIGLDRDDEAIAMARERLAPFGSRAKVLHENFSRLEGVLDELMIDSVDGIFLDLGVSSMQFDQAERGFSFEADATLDMRMDRSQEETARDLVNSWPRGDLVALFRTFGEGRSAGRIASAIVRARNLHPIRTTSELSRIVSQSVSWESKGRKIHPATRVFLALRAQVNQELQQLETFLESCPDRLRPGGRIGVISFHSLEDRLVKQAFRKHAKPCTCPPGLPWCSCGTVPRLRVVTTSPLRPSLEEERRNPRSRSAKLRVAERM